MITAHLQEIEKYLHRAGIEKWEIICDVTTRSPVLFEYDKLKEIGHRETCGVGLRIIHAGRVGFTCTSNPDQFPRLPEAALASAAYGQEAVFEFPTQPANGHVETYHESVAQLKSETLVGRGEQVVSRMKSELSETQALVEFQPTIHRRWIKNSSGCDAAYELSELSVSVGGILVEENSILSVYESFESCRDDTPLDDMTTKVIDSVRRARRVVDFPSGAYPVLFSPKAAASILIGLQMGTNGKLVQKKASPLIEKTGTLIADSRITIVDNPLIDLKPGSRPFDDEGVVSRLNTVVESGILRGFLFDLQTAGLLGRDSTGSAGRSFSSPPSPTWSNLVMEPGEKTFEEILAKMDRGLVVDQVLGSGQSNLLMGEFSLNVSLGYRVEDGEMVGRVKNVMVAGNVYEAFSSVREISREREYTHRMLLPSILFESLQVTPQA